MKPEIDASKLLNNDICCDIPPWNSGVETLIEDFLRKLIRDIELSTDTKSFAEFDHYGSGGSSYVDVWFYRKTEEFKRSNNKQHYNGLFILMSRQANYYVVGESERTWTVNESTSSFELPSLKAVDHFKHDCVQKLSNNIEPILNSLGLIRLNKEELSKPLDPDLIVPTILSDPPFALFDAIFNWED